MSPAKKRPKRFDQNKGVRKLARERVGTVPPARAMVPKDLRKKPKHKPDIEESDE